MSRGAFFLLAALVSAPCGGQELGRLFFSPAERAALDAQRRTGAVAPQVPSPAPMRVDGYVVRSGAAPTVWVNGSTAGPGSATDEVRITPGAQGSGEVAVSRRHDRTSRRVKVGNTLDAASGQVQDLLRDGELRVRR